MSEKNIDRKIEELSQNMQNLDPNGFWYELPQELKEGEAEEGELLQEIENALKAWFEEGHDSQIEKLILDVQDAKTLL